ncbi:zinc finger protein basonuclin-1 isoform X2 [Puntigrus tetrazona]|nr:zinc finger protein basonuclin-1 isoform X2 [Puntigrus tetrazona]
MVIRALDIDSGPQRSHQSSGLNPAEHMGTWTHTLLQETDRDELLLKRDDQTSALKMDKVVSCTHAECVCECFLPGQTQIRSCDRCAHGWVVHAVGKVCAPALLCSGQVEIVQSSVVFDISSLILYGTQALPVRMKILLDRLFSVLTHTQVLNIIHTLGWTLRDYVRGYMLQDSMGKVLDRWVTMSPEDEAVTLRQFLRFGETKSIVELMAEEQQLRPETHCGAALKLRENKPPSRTHHFEDLPGGSLAFLQPFHYVGPSVFPPSPAADGHPATQKLQRLSKRNIADETRTRHKIDGAAKRASLMRTFAKCPRNEEQRQADPIADSSETSERRSSSCSSKARVSCSACAKTFYDKGTLKIHFNAVHLKIKHRCTVDGCNMMFSSLRSRNRHSANPNPRLHAALEHATRRFIAQPRRTALREATSLVSATIESAALTDCRVPGGGGATGHHRANRNGLGGANDVTPKKKSRKSSTPLKLNRETHSEERDRLSPRQPVDSLHGNHSPAANAHTQCKYKQFCKTAYGYHSYGHAEEIGTSRPLLKVKEEPCDCRGRHHSNL